MTRLGLLAGPLALAIAASGCVSSIVVSQAVIDMNRTRVGADVKDAAVIAPDAYRQGEAERALAEEAAAKGDATAADLHAERAEVLYERAVVIARLARATEAEGAARAKLTTLEAEVEKLTAAKVPFEKDAEALANDLAVARLVVSPAHVAPADPARERARLVAARSLLAEGQLLCGAARLLAHKAPLSAADASLLDAAEHEEADALASLDRPRGPATATPIDAAANARASCLAVLTRGRRAAGGANVGDADALLSALSAHGGWDPSRDERGVVVTLRGAFKGASLTAPAEQELKELGHVASVHPSFPLQLVLHDATAPDKATFAADTQRVHAALTALTNGGASATDSTTETVGARLPLSDPSDPVTRAGNARLEVVFVSRSE